MINWFEELEDRTIFDINANGGAWELFGLGIAFLGLSAFLPFYRLWYWVKYHVVVR